MAQFIEQTDLDGNPVIVNIERIDSIKILGVNAARVIVNREKILVCEKLRDIVRKLPNGVMATAITLNPSMPTKSRPIRDEKAHADHRPPNDP